MSNFWQCYFFSFQEQEKTNGIDRSKFKVPVHLDHKNPDGFEVEDLRKLIKQVPFLINVFSLVTCLIHFHR